MWLLTALQLMPVKARVHNILMENIITLYIYNIYLSL